MSMLRTPLQSTQDEHVERALQKFNTVSILFLLCHKDEVNTATSRPSSSLLEDSLVHFESGRFVGPEDTRCDSVNLMNP